MIKNLFKDMAKYLPSNVAPAIVSIVALPIITRLFLPGEYGKYVLVMGAVYILTPIASWINSSIIRFYPVYEKRGESINFTRMTIKLSFLSILIISIFFFVILLLMKSSINRDFYLLLNIGIIVIILFSSFEVLLSFLRIKRLINWYSGFFVWKSIAMLVFGVLFVISFHFGVEGLLYGAILSVVLALPFLWKIAIGKLWIRNKGLTFQSTIEMAKYSFPIAISIIAAWILGLSDRYMIQIFRGASEVGIYSISYQLSSRSIMFFISLFAVAYGPLAIIAWEKEGKEKSQEFLTKVTRYFLLLCIPSVVGISVLREPILRILSTSNYYEGSNIIPFVASGVLIFGLSQRFGACLIFYKKPQFITYSLIISGCVNIVLNVLFIPKYGYIAAAVTTLISYSFMLLLSIVFSRRFLIWKFPFMSLTKIIFASFCMGIIVYFIRSRLASLMVIDLILSVSIGGVIYFCMLFLLGEIRPKEKKMIKKIIEKLLSLSRHKYQIRS